MHSIRLSDFAKMTPTEQEAVLAEMIRVVRSPPTLADLIRARREVHKFERAGGMRTEELQRGLSTGAIRETETHCHWIMAHHRWSRLRRTGTS